MSIMPQSPAAGKPESPNMLKAALWYASAGLEVFPLWDDSIGPDGKPRGKRPRIAGGQNESTTDQAQITEWWTQMPTSNIGIHCRPSGLFVIDIDAGLNPDGTPKVGFESWAQLTDGRNTPRTFSVRTRSGGLHLYYRVPVGAAVSSLKNTDSKLAKNIDTRGNGYVVAPPSIFGGSSYTIKDNIPFAELPEWIIDALTPPVRAYAPLTPSDVITRPPVTHAPADAVIKRVEALALELNRAPEGQGNAEGARIAFMVGQYVGAGQIDEHTAVSILLSQGLAGWQSYAGMEKTIRLQVGVGAQSPRPWEAARFQDSKAAATPVTQSEEKLPSAATDWATDDGQARYLLEYITGILYVIGIGWHLWDGKRWLPVDEERVSHIVKSHYKSRFDHYMGRYTDTMDDKHLKSAEMIKKFMASSKQSSILTAMKCIAPMVPDQLDAHPDLLNTPSGVVDMRTGEVAEHDPKLLMTKITKGSYRPGYRHPDWQAALEAVPDDVRDYFQLRVGQAATGYIPKSDDCLILQGNGANGKSLMTSDGVMRALGDFAMLASPGLILAKDSSGGASPERASVRGARFVLIEELPEGRSVSIDELKRIIGTSQITARKLYKDEMTFTTSHTLLVTTNYLPTVNETDDGAWRRLCLVNFPYRFTGAPVGPDEKLGDPNMKERVRDGSDGQHDAIVTWIIEGSVRYFADPSLIMSHNRPERITADIRGWRGQADRIMAYFDARLVRDVDGMVAKSDLYSDFCAFLTENGHSKWSQETFFGRLTKHELYRRHGMQESTTRNPADLSRPDLPDIKWSTNLPKLPARPWVIKGVRFRCDTDDIQAEHDLTVAA